MKHYRVKFKPDEKSISIHAGATLLEAAESAGFILNTVCGSNGTCGKCVVRIEPGGQEVQACQYRIQDDICVFIPAESRFFEQKILQHGIEPDIEIKPGGEAYGVAVDIGTTTVVAKLIDMHDGKCMATAAATNPQVGLGEDVIARIEYAETQDGLEKLNELIIECINKLVGQLCERGGIEPADILEVVAAGNTVMNHIFLKFPVKQLGQIPYEAFSVEAHQRSALEMGIKINPAGKIRTIENIAGFVGSDTMAVAIAVEMDSAEEMTLVVDIGTNGEILLGTKDKLYAASCAAGPAFEGARISQGSRAVEGAIERVVINADDIDLDVIGAVGGRSVCGSGLIDAVAVLLDLGVIDVSGRFVEAEQLKDKLSEAILRRIIIQDDQPGFVLSYGENGQEPAVVLTQKDVRETQLAKAAIRAGIKILQKKIGIKDEDIQRVLLAGAFGNYTSRESAKRIGLLPDVAIERVHFVGNAASTGAHMILLSQKSRDIAADLADRIEYVEIAGQADFSTVFTESILF